MVAAVKQLILRLHFETCIRFYAIVRVSNERFALTDYVMVSVEPDNRHQSKVTIPSVSAATGDNDGGGSRSCIKPTVLVSMPRMILRRGDSYIKF